MGETEGELGGELEDELLGVLLSLFCFIHCSIVIFKLYCFAWHSSFDTIILFSSRFSTSFLSSPMNSISCFIYGFSSILVVVCGDGWPRFRLLLLSQLAGGVAGENVLPAVIPGSIGGLCGDIPPTEARKCGWRWEEL